MELSAKELKRLSRLDLMELLLKEVRRNKELEARNEELEKMLKNREILLSDAGNIAEAALRLNGIFDAAQKAAEDYVENVKRLSSGAVTDPSGASVSGEE